MAKIDKWFISLCLARLTACFGFEQPSLVIPLYLPPTIESCRWGESIMLHIGERPNKYKPLAETNPFWVNQRWYYRGSTGRYYKSGLKELSVLDVWCCFYRINDYVLVLLHVWRVSLFMVMRAFWLYIYIYIIFVIVVVLLLKFLCTKILFLATFVSVSNKSNLILAQAFYYWLSQIGL